jgi:hypothetical protein
MGRRVWIQIFLIALFAISIRAGDQGGDAEYVGGTVALPLKVDGKIQITDAEIFSFRSKKAAIRIPYDKIHTLEYGQRVDRRYVTGLLISPVLLLAKARKHYLTIGFTDEEGKQQAMVFQVDKSDIRAILAGLEAKTGRRIEFQDEDARKAGRG